MVSLISVTKISNLKLASVAKQAGLSLTWSETPEDTFSHDEAQIQVAQRATIAHLSPMCQGQISFQKTYKWAMETKGWKSN